VLVLKLASTGWRMSKYYRHADEYTRRGPPHVLLRVFVAPVTVISTLVLFGTGVLLLLFNETRGTLVGLHKASFIVWVGAIGVHVLAHVLELPGALRARIPGTALRLTLVGAVLVSGALLAIATLPSADRLQDRATSHFGFDDG
jgi:hypothetical protein